MQSNLKIIGFLLIFKLYMNRIIKYSLNSDYEGSKSMYAPVPFSRKMKACISLWS
jgi:hypothetical protein